MATKFTFRLRECLGWSESPLTAYNLTSIAPTPMNRLPWLIRTRFLSPYEILPKAQENKYLENFSHFIMELYVVVLIRIASSRRFSWVQSTFQYCIENRKASLNYHHSLPVLVPWLTLSGSNYPYLIQVSMVPKMFEPLKFDCIYDKDHDHTDLFCIVKKWNKRHNYVL